MRFLKRLFKDQTGGSAIVISAALIPTLAAVGAAVDGGYAIVVRNQLGAAVDAAALAGGRAFFDPARDTQVRNFFDSNFNLAGAGVTVTNFAITEPGSRGGGGGGGGGGGRGLEDGHGEGNDDRTDNETSGESLLRLKVDASAKVPTLFMRVFGYNEISVSASAVARREQSPLELVMALDNTASMKLTAGTKTRIAALKDATRDLLSALYGNPDPSDPGGGPANPNLKIGILPYTTMVNVGGHLWREQAARGVSYLDMPDGYTYAPNDPLGWKGCMDADQTDNLITSATNANTAASFANALDTQDYEPGAAGKPKLKPFFYPSIGIWSTWSDPPRWDPGEDCSTWTTREERGGGYWHETWREGELVSRTWVEPWTRTVTCVPRPAREIPGASGGWWSYDHRYEVPATYPKPARWPTPQAGWPRAQLYPSSNGEIVDGWRSPNLYCPAEALLPQSYNYGQLVSYVNNNLKAYDPPWGTYTNVALQWAIRMVSDSMPLAPSGGGGGGAQKAIVLMTDGFLYAEPWLYARSPYGFPDERGLVNSASPSHSQMNDALAKRLERLCIEARNANIAVYTVTFALPGDDARKNLYRTCATTPAMYFDAVDANALAAAFRSIGSDLSALRLEE